jgi:N-acetyl sugar amidotransferase
MIRWCKSCLMPSSRPRMIIPDDGICPACRYHESKKEIDWDAREAEFDSVVAGYRGSGDYDCVVPFSGGKDSATIAHKLKHVHGLNPLLVCYGQLMWTDVGRYNFHQVANAGFDIIYWRTNQAVSRQLARRFFIERGHPKQHYDAAVNSVPVRTAVNFNIPLIFYAEHGESEYGGHILSEEHRRSRDLAEVLEHQVGDDPRNWAVDGLTERDLHPYIYPEASEIEKVGVKALYYSHFFPWDIYENAKYAREKMGFRQARGHDTVMLDGPRAWWGKSDGSFEGFDSIDDKIDDLDFYMMHIKFGFGRAARMASRLIQGGHIDRDFGLFCVKGLDGEPAHRYRKATLDYLSMSFPEYRKVIDSHRNPEIWKQEDGEWTLRYPPV